MIKNIANILIRKLGKQEYTVDSNLNSKDLSLQLSSRGIQAIRGAFIKPFLRSSKGVLFLGRRTKILHPYLISVGESLTIGDSVEINALSKKGIRFGNNVTILRNTIIECTGVLREIGEGLWIGDNVGIAQNCFIQVRGPVKIGSQVILGPGVSIFSENHNIDEIGKPIISQGAKRIGITIQDGAWIGSGATILDGVTVGAQSVVAAGSVVVKDVPQYSIVGGVPARIIRHRNLQEKRTK